MIVSIVQIISNQPNIITPPEHFIVKNPPPHHIITLNPFAFIARGDDVLAVVNLDARKACTARRKKDVQAH